ncbi:DUF4123 domain-containing protein [Ralstonia sp. 1138]|uniref:DUF4123 domain-containing protein n=1 Tax=Ralstonia sp. 1138 TaxID=3156423 RepID=UPI0033975E80
MPHPDAVARSKELAAGYHALQRQQKPGDRPLRAYLLLNAWEGNQLAASIALAWPEAAAARAAVPDDFYAGREDQAPCVVPVPDSALPDGTSDTLEQAHAQDTLAPLLEAASRQAHQRLVRQDLGAVLFSADSAACVAQYLRMLGLQYPPQSRRAKVFRYQDPRVMQRVWPELSAAQQGMWLGAVQAWWTLSQPWGPWAMEDLVETESVAAPIPAWFKAERTMVPDGQTETLMVNRLMDMGQWGVAHSAPVGNQSWAAFASAKVPTTQQPDGAAMSAAIARGQRLGLDGQDLEAFIEVSWLLPGEAGATHAHARNWDDAPNRAALEHTLSQMRSQSGLRFASAWLSTQLHPDRSRS